MTDYNPTKSLTVKCPGEFTGKQQDWERWKGKYTNYTSSIDWRYGKMFTDIENTDRTLKITEDWISDWDLNNPCRVTDRNTKEIKQLSNDLYGQLSDMLQGPAANLCRKHAKQRCGLSVWKELCNHYCI